MPSPPNSILEGGAFGEASCGRAQKISRIARPSQLRPVGRRKRDLDEHPDQLYHVSFRCRRGKLVLPHVFGTPGTCGTASTDSSSGRSRVDTSQRLGSFEPPTHGRKRVPFYEVHGACPHCLVSFAGPRGPKAASWALTPTSLEAQPITCGHSLASSRTIAFSRKGDETATKIALQKTSNFRD